jgi:HD-GYP domain-containing protein (c-di-GMP phosphodiesterase class II)
MAMWNGKGVPATAGPAIPPSCRIMQVAATAVLFAVHAGAEAAVAQVRRRAGSYLDPDLAGVFVDRAGELLADLDHIDAYECVLDAEPDPVRLVDGEGSEALARTFGHLVDLKSPYLHGHSAGVGDLTAAAAQSMGLDEQVRTVRIAGYLHDLGRVGVSSRIWDKPGR